MRIAIVLIHLSEKGAFINTLLKRTADYFLALKKKSFHIFNLVGIVSERLWQLGLLQDAHVQAVSMRAWWPGHLLSLQTAFAVTPTQEVCLDNSRLLYLESKEVLIFKYYIVKGIYFCQFYILKFKNEKICVKNQALSVYFIVKCFFFLKNAEKY